MHEDLPPPLEPLRQEMRVGIAEHEHDLKEQKTGAPDRWTSSVPGKDIAGNQRLNLKQQEGAQKDSGGISDHVVIRREEYEASMGYRIFLL